MERRTDYVMRKVEDRGVRLVRLLFTDVHGQLKSLNIGPTELETAFEEGMLFDGSSIDGFSRIAEEDVLARPDANSFQLLNWNDSDERVGRMFCDIESADGEAFEGDTRQVLRRQLDRARELGFTFFVAPELEYFLFQDGDPSTPLVPLDSGSYFDLTTADVASSIRQRTLQALESMGISVEYSFHEDAPSQHEIDLRYTDALTMADNVMTFRLVVKEIAIEHGVHATFMPKPMAAHQGSGMHTHLSLFRGDKNAFHDPDGEAGLTPVARQFMAGLLRHASDITAVTNQLVNSYKRLVPGFEAPVSISWARSNRAALIRVPSIKKGKPDSARIEYRAPDPACNPYLTFALLLAAGLDGVENKYEPPSEAPKDLFKMTSAEMSAAGHGPLPDSLGTALDRLEASQLAQDVLGTHLFEWFVRNKRAEFADYKTQVSQFELDRYLRNV
ncbi:MAG: type I glutamate--ammonia ligase [Actinomycetia bacterium]|nr:type I glutamate--ammonia ligase [Actinomycetes bacterium]MCP4961573.1 type I glutamate--ammonia ligase [Actinomycetes bacterium]